VPASLQIGPPRLKVEKRPTRKGLSPKRSFSHSSFSTALNDTFSWVAAFLSVLSVLLAKDLSLSWAEERESALGTVCSWSPNNAKER
jgi:hypothetical protein